MAITVKHSKVSTIPDDADTSLVRPSDWNADHTLVGTVPVDNGGTGASTLTGYVKGNGTAAMTASATVPSTDITGLGTMSTQNANNIAVTGGTMSGVAITGYIPTTEKGVANGVATLDAGGQVPVSQLPPMGDLNYQGTWNATTNTPTLTSSVGTKGYYYVVSVAGTTNLNGITDWQIGDWAVFNGSIWQKIDNTDAVTSVNGYTGTVVLTQTDISGTVPTSRTLTAGTGLTGGGDLSADRTFAIDSTVATLTGTQTLTNKTLTSPKVNEILDANGNEVLGLLSTSSATDYVGIKNGIGVGVPLHISCEGSSTNIGLHIQPKGSGLVTISDGTDFNKGIRFRSSSSAASAITLLDAVATAGRVVTLPDATTTLVGRDTTDTLTNKSISGSTNTLSNIGNASLTNSAITINGTSTSLGGSISVGTVTSVTGTAPVVSSGGATPAISMPAATTSVDGYLTSTDWNTFNGKGSGTVTSVGGTGTVNGITLTGTVTSSGNLTLGGTLSGVDLATQVTGNLPVTNLGSGTGASASTFWRGDGSWASVSASTATNLAGGALGSVPYQLLSGTTTFLAGNTTTTPQFLSSTGVAGIATAPTYTSSTGSGNVVLATSPTLVTPALGTPSSGVVTNLTGTASININGTVGATTATTGAFTTLSASGVTTVQAGTVSAPAITTTGDTNTGIFFPAADTIAFTEGGVESMRIDSSGNVGIGTSSPGTKLDVSGNLRFSAANPVIELNNGGPQVYSTIANTLQFASGGGIGSPTERMRITSAGLLQFDSGYGSVATAYGCRAWVNFNGTGTVAIRASGNVSSITDVAAGNYIVNFTTAMPDTNYAFTGAGTGGGAMNAGNVAYNWDANNKTTSALQIYTLSTSYTAVDANQVNVSVFR